MIIGPADPADTTVQALLQAHHDLMRSTSPEESCHVMAPQAIADDPQLRLFAAREPQTVLGVGALKALDGQAAEVKSMHIVAKARGRGVGQAILSHLMAEAKSLGITRLLLETGSAEVFRPARKLYETAGFAYCPPFGTHTDDPLSVFMARDL